MLNITTPGLLFPALSLLMLAFTNRFLAIASLVRTLKSKYETSKEENIRVQILLLSKRLKLIRNMQTLGVISLLLCTTSMFFIFIQNEIPAVVLFILSLISMALALVISLREIVISVNAIEIEIGNVLNHE